MIQVVQNMPSRRRLRTIEDQARAIREGWNAFGIGLGINMMYGSGPPAVADPFDPLVDAGVAPFLWFDMQDAASYTQAGTVTSITNKASSTAWTEATNPPTYNATGINSRPCMVGNGTSMRIVSSEAAVVAALADNIAYTLFFVVQAVTVDVASAWFGVGSSAHSGQRVKVWGQNTGGTGQWRITTIDNAIATLNAQSALSTANANVNVIEFVVTNAAASIIVNGGTPDPNATAHAPGTLTPNQAALFCRPDSAPDTFSDAKIGEVLGYPGALGSTARGNVRAYLGNRWGVTVA